MGRVYQAWALVLVAMFVGSCQSGPQTLSDKHTGDVATIAAASNAYTGLFDWLQVRPFHSSRRGYGVQTLYSNYGWKFLSEAWSFGKKLDYLPGQNETAMCGGAGGCITLEAGTILLSETDFRQAAVRGLEFELVGSGGKVVGKIASARFAEVLSKEP